jgi:hypothetical protein
MYTVAIIMCVVGFSAIIVGAMTVAFSYDSEHIGMGLMVFGAILAFGGVMTGMAEDDRRANEFETACTLQHGVVVDDGKLCVSTEDGRFLDIQRD